MLEIEDPIYEEVLKLRAQVEMMGPLFDWAVYLAKLWEPFNDRIPENQKELVRIYHSTVKGRENNTAESTDNSTDPNTNHPEDPERSPADTGTGANSSSPGNTTAAEANQNPDM